MTSQTHTHINAIFEAEDSNLSEMMVDFVHNPMDDDLSSRPMDDLDFHDL